MSFIIGARLHHFVGANLASEIDNEWLFGLIGVASCGNRATDRLTVGRKPDLTELPSRC